ncbi:MAG TPA: hypothetical protein DEP46_12915 [Blastocatellia bacterium]|nr:hypothetical protein [Blastocatellia bacterium]
MTLYPETSNSSSPAVLFSSPTERTKPGVERPARRRSILTPMSAGLPASGCVLSISVAPRKMK